MILHFPQILQRHQAFGRNHSHVIAGLLSILIILIGPVLCGSCWIVGIDINRHRRIAVIDQRPILHLESIAAFPVLPVRCCFKFRPVIGIQAAVDGSGCILIRGLAKDRCAQGDFIADLSGAAKAGKSAGIEIENLAVLIADLNGIAVV